ncbi:MAG: hypothetical protein Q7R95_08775 [bacterium]|nr:hypothetical protein [bacterium]
MNIELEDKVVCIKCGGDGIVTGATARRVVGGSKLLSIGDDLFIECDICGKYPINKTEKIIRK